MMDIELSTLFKMLVFLFCITALVLIIFQLVFIVRFKLLQRRYSRAILATNAGVWEWFPKSNRLYISPEFFVQLGFDEKKIPSHLPDLMSLLSLADQAAFAQWKAILLGQNRGEATPISIRLHIEVKQSKLYWVEMRGSVTRWDKFNRAQSVAGTLEEISYLVDTENKLISAREEARGRELMLSSLINNIPDMIWSKNEQGQYLDCNQAFTEFNQLSVQDIQGRNDKELNLDGKGEYYGERDHAALEQGETLHEQSWGYPKDGGEARLFEVYRVPVVEPSIHFRGTLGIARDITERHQLISQLKLFKSFADNSAQGFAMSTLDGHITYINKKIRTLLGIDEGVSEASKPFYYLDFYPESSQKFLQDTVIPYVREHGVWEGELQVQSADGRIFDTYETYFLLRDEKGRAISVGDIMSDVSEQKSVSLQLELAKEAAEQANQAKSHFLANMSHEIRTPLNAIIGYAQLISEEDQLTDITRTRFLAIAGAGERLLSLINDILDIARIESGRLVLHEQKVNLYREVTQIGKLLQGQAQQKGLSLLIECDIDEQQYVLLDPVKLQQILTNLIGNAVKFTAKGYVKVVVQQQGDLIHVVIEDTGPGIEPELMEHLFTPFVQGRAGAASGGTGLGLALSTTLVKLMKGTLSVQSTEGVGTHVIITLPLVKVEQEVGKDSDEQELGSNARLNIPITVLVAEDDDWSRDILVSLLEKAGCQILEARDGEQAIRLLQSNTPDLVMTDIRMPNKTGIDLLQAIQQQDPQGQIPVVAVTASTLIHEQQALLDEGFWQVIGKPYRAEDIYQALVAHLDVHFVALFDQATAVLGKVDNNEVSEETQALLSQLTDADWWPLWEAAKNGDMQQAEQAFQALKTQLPLRHQKSLQGAIEQFDLGRVEELIAQYQEQGK